MMLARRMMMYPLLSSLLFFFFFFCIVFARVTAIIAKEKEDCPCGGSIPPRPDVWHKAAVARWMVHALDWGVLSTLSTRFSSQDSPVPFGNVYSFVDGPCDNATGVPYFYGTYMDQSLQDMLRNPVASLTLSEASLTTACGNSDDTRAMARACRVSAGGDAESPLCARLTLTGRLVPVHDDAMDEEFRYMRDALFERHGQMAHWPRDHDWVLLRLENLTDIWLVDYFGGAAVIAPDDYFGVQLRPAEEEGFRRARTWRL